ncbi:MAG: PCI domain-containing protein [Rickettsia endosymbiont of Ixodes persulcatus]|nr:PCI domain-containing protein [Rickettsia endosymbiont of Ixodes persulcatus]
MDVFIKFQDFDLEVFLVDVVRSVDSHNLCVISKFCTLVSIKDLSCLLQCKNEDVINKVCWVVNNRILDCKIDQSKQLVRFNKSLEPDWMKGVDVVLERIMEANHLIHNENLKYIEKNKN